MTRLFVPNSAFRDPILDLSDDDHHHLAKVLRIKPGATLEIVINGTELAIIELKSIHPGKLVFGLLSRKSLPPSPFPNITLVQALPKQDKFTEVIKKCTEIGVSHYIPLLSSRVANIPSDRNFDGKLKRWTNTLKSAAMQSQQSQIPTIDSPIEFSDLITQFDSYKKELNILFWEEAKEPSLKTLLDNQTTPKSVMIIIGPEGGFSENEVTQLQENTCQIASLGPTILRTENAAFYAAANIQYQFS